MEINGDFIFDAPQELTWQAIQDVDVLASIMPGGEDFKQVGENEYSGLLNIKVGPVQGKFTGTIKLSDIIPLEGYSIQVDGKGSPGFVKASGSLKLTAEGDKTHMTYTGSAQVGGRIASVGQRLMETSAKSIIRQSLEEMNEYLKVKAATSQAEETAGSTAEDTTETPAAPPTPAYQPPSQADVTLKMFKDIFNDLVPAQVRPLIGAALAFLLGLLIGRKLQK
jgi:carbon monoxide dehydrogenase subunit G